MGGWVVVEGRIKKSSVYFGREKKEKTKKKKKNHFGSCVSSKYCLKPDPLFPSCFQAALESGTSRVISLCLKNICD